MSFFSKKKVFIILSVTLFLLIPSGFFVTWFFAAHKFKSEFVKSLNSIASSFEYSKCDIEGFASGAVSLNFSDPVLRFSQGPQGFILRFDQVRLDTGFKFTDVVITPKGDLRLKVGAEKLKIKNIKKAQLRLGQDSQKSFSINQSEVLIQSDDQTEKIDQIKLQIDSFLEEEKNQINAIKFMLAKSNKETTNLTINVKNNTESIIPKYHLEIKEISFCSGDLYKVFISGNPTVSFTYRYNFDGELIAKIENYDNFFNAMTVKSGDLPDDKALKVIGFLKDNAVTNGNFAEIKFIGNDEGIFVGNQNFSNFLSSLFSIKDLVKQED